jgi:hypothetical protein
MSDQLSDPSLAASLFVLTLLTGVLSLVYPRRFTTWPSWIGIHLPLAVVLLFRAYLAATFAPGDAIRVDVVPLFLVVCLSLTIYVGRLRKVSRDVQAWWYRRRRRLVHPLPLLRPILAVNALVLGALGLIDLINLGHTWLRGYKLLGGSGLIDRTVQAYVILILLNVLGYVLIVRESLWRRPWLGLAALALGVIGTGRALTFLVTEPGPRVIGLMVGEVVAAAVTLVLVFRPDRSADRGSFKKPGPTED